MTAQQPAGAGAARLQIWLGDLDATHGALERCEATERLLAPSEQVWTTPLPADARRRRRSARIALRLLLARAGAAGARGGELAADPYGKPHLAGCDLAFSISHSGPAALFAIASRGPIGVDVETDRSPQLGMSRTAQLIAAGTAICPAAAAGSSPAAGSALLRAWTGLEAFAKARGDGIGALLTELGVTAAGARSLPPSAIADRAAAVRAASGLGVLQLALPAGSYGAIAGPLDLLTAVPPEVQPLATLLFA